MSDLTTGEFTGRGFEHGRIFKKPQNFKVTLDSGAVIHRDVHRRGYHTRAGAAHKAEAHRIVGDSAGEFSDNIRSRGHHQIKVRPTRKVDVLERARFDGAVLQVDRALGEACKRKRSDKLRRGFGHANANFGTFLLQ